MSVMPGSYTDLDRDLCALVAWGGRVQIIFKEVTIWITDKTLFLRCPWGDVWQGQCFHGDVSPMVVTYDKVKRSGVRLELVNQKNQV